MVSNLPAGTEYTYIVQAVDRSGNGPAQTEQATFTENVDANNGIDVTAGDLNVTNNTNVTGALDVDGATTLDQVSINSTLLAS